MAADYNTEPVGRQRAVDALADTCVKDFGCPPADLPWGQDYFFHMCGCAVRLYRLHGDTIRQSDLLTVWINGYIPGTRAEPVFSPIAPNLVEQGISLVNPIIALDLEGDPLRVVLIDNAAHADEVFSQPGPDSVDALEILKSTPVKYQQLVRRIGEVACAVAFMGAQAAASRPTQ
jgi:hypothetical protein